MAKKKEQENGEVNEVAEAVSLTRVKRMSISSELATPEASNVGHIVISIVDHPEVVEFFYTVPEGLSPLLLKAIDSGFSNRFSISGAGKKDPQELHDKLVKEALDLNEGKFATRSPAEKVEFADIIHAYALSELADDGDVEVLKTYQAKYDSLTKEDKIKLRFTPKVKRQLNNIENAKIEAELAAEEQAA